MYIMSALSYGPAGREGLLAWRMEQEAGRVKPQPSNSIEYSHTWRKPAMKVFGSVALGSSSARKYLSTCVSCFQKLRVSCRKYHVSELPSLG
jgi:hypothetical protein